MFPLIAHSTIRSKEQLHTTEALCEMCEQYSTQALSYLNQNETQTEILSLLYKTCSKLQPLRQQVQIIVIKVLSPQNCTVEGN
jgi:Saposin-like type B, region 1